MRTHSFFTIISSSAVVLLTSIAALGCDDDDNPLGDGRFTQPTGAGIVSSEDVVDRIAQQRCEREFRCNNIGIGEEYPTRESCIASVRARTSEELKPSECPAGISQSEFNECVSAIQGESCDNPLESLERLGACRKGELCPGQI